MADDLSMETFMHEPGYAWSISATRESNSGDDCDMHTCAGNGKDFQVCLWHATCITSGRNPLPPHAWEEQAISNPGTVRRDSVPYVTRPVIMPLLIIPRPSWRPFFRYATAGNNGLSNGQDKLLYF
jgi:hypothetical protein